MRAEVSGQKELAEVELARGVQVAAAAAIARERSTGAGRSEQRRAEPELQPLTVRFPSLHADVEAQVAQRNGRVSDATATDALALRIVAVEGQKADRQRDPKRQTLEH